MNIVENFKLIRIYVERDPKTIIKTILESCGLSTEYVNQIKNSTTKATPPNLDATMTRRGNIFYDGVKFRDESELRENIQKAQAEKTLT